ncbi:MAG: excinuclease ABC subunit UvrC [Thermodesulfobacteriota bacterium]
MDMESDQGDHENRLKDLLQKAPAKPGVYLMKNRKGQVIYVGKAKDLRRRLTSYFVRKEMPDLKTTVLVQQVAELETIVTASEKEALILESNLIKKLRPRYNVILKDDKRYPSLRLNTEEPYPYLSIVRKIKNDGGLVFGPYTSSAAVGKTLKLINRTFKLRKCRTRAFAGRTRPCLNYQMGTCLGPCCLPVDPAEYQTIVDEVVLFLSGRTPALIKNIKEAMLAAAADEDYERAVVLRDKMFALEKTLEKQAAVSTDFADRDVVAVAGDFETRVLTILFVRGGFIQGIRHFVFKESLAGDPELMEAFVRQFYEQAQFIPREILVTVLPENPSLVEDWLHMAKGKKVRLLSPQRGDKKMILRLALENAAKEQRQLTDTDHSLQKLLERLQHKLMLPRMPERIECFDNSTLAGSSPVAGMVVYHNGRADKHSYRRYRLRNITVPDDYASMQEVMQRRFGHRKPGEPLPDLLLVDGGRGQLGVVCSLLTEFGLNHLVPAAGIAKKEARKGETEDKVYLPGRSNPIGFGLEKDLLLFLQQIRDEAHRFAISFHHQRRSTVSLRSVLDDIPGVGPKRKKMLLRHFGSLEKIRAATPEEIGALPGMSVSLAETILEALGRNKRSQTKD